MEEKEIPDLNIFMVCEKVDKSAFSQLPIGFKFRLCRENELEIWKGFHFDSDSDKVKFHEYMTKYFENTYQNGVESFFDKCLFVVNEKDQPVATCFAWKAYGKVVTIHWFKTLKQYEGMGIGRALLTKVMKGIGENEYPVLLHTQPSSFRAIKLYSDFGFKIATNPKIGARVNQYQDAMPILKEFMKPEAYKKLELKRIDDKKLNLIKNEKTNQF